MVSGPIGTYSAKAGAARRSAVKISLRMRKRGAHISRARRAFPIIYTEGTLATRAQEGSQDTDTRTLCDVPFYTARSQLLRTNRQGPRLLTDRHKGSHSRQRHPADRRASLLRLYPVGGRLQRLAGNHRSEARRSAKGGEQGGEGGCESGGTFGGRTGAYSLWPQASRSCGRAIPCSRSGESVSVRLTRAQLVR